MSELPITLLQTSRGMALGRSRRVRRRRFAGVLFSDVLRRRPRHCLGRSHPLEPFFLLPSRTSTSACSQAPVRQPVSQGGLHSTARERAPRSRATTLRPASLASRLARASTHPRRFFPKFPRFIIINRRAMCNTKLCVVSIMNNREHSRTFAAVAFAPSRRRR